jgi:hypothetical protein
MIKATAGESLVPQALMKKVAAGKIPVLSVSPMSLVCPFCKAKRGQDCGTTSGGLAAVHVQRIKVAALINKARKVT